MKNKGVNGNDLILLIILVFSCAVIIPIVFMFLSDIAKNAKKTDPILNGVYLFLICFVLLFYSILSALNEYKKVFNKDYYLGTKIVFKEKNKTIVSTSSIYFIGMTKAFIFLYDKINKKCIVYKNEDIIKLEFPDKRR
jgi:hypothetical protein